MYYLIFALLALLFIKMLILIAPFVPVHSKDLDRIAFFVEKYQIKNLADLGSGNARVIKFLANKFPDKYFTGLELAPTLFLCSKFRLNKINNAKVKWGNVYFFDWTNYDGLFMFWRPQYFRRNIEKILMKVREGQYIISYAFEIIELKSKEIEVSKAEKSLPIFIYRI